MYIFFCRFDVTERMLIWVCPMCLLKMSAVQGWGRGLFNANIVDADVSTFWCKKFEFFEIMVCPLGGRGLSQYGHFSFKGGGVNFCLCLIDSPLWNISRRNPYFYVTTSQCMKPFILMINSLKERIHKIYYLSASQTFSTYGILL